MPARASAKKKTKTLKAKAKKPAMKMKAKAPKLTVLGRCVHFYDRIGVAIVELNRPIKLGDKVKFKRNDFESKQKANSLQIEHEAVKAAKKGQVIGMKVTEEIPKGALMIPA